MGPTGPSGPDRQTAGGSVGNRADTVARVDPNARAAAVAVEGAQGDPATLPAVLGACDDKPAIRRRAVLALAAFEGDGVEARLHAALQDPDWQVRQAAEDLLAVSR